MGKRVGHLGVGTGVWHWELEGCEWGRGWGTWGWGRGSGIGSLRGVNGEEGGILGGRGGGGFGIGRVGGVNGETARHWVGGGWGWEWGRGRGTQGGLGGKRAATLTRSPFVRVLVGEGESVVDGRDRDVRMVHQTEVVLQRKRSVCKIRSRRLAEVSEGQEPAEGSGGEGLTSVGEGQKVSNRQRSVDVRD